MGEFSLNDEVTSDLRWQALWRGLGQLNATQLRRILDHLESGGLMVCDTYNYDEERGLWCPLAIGLNIPRLVDQWQESGNMNNELAKYFIREIGEQSFPGFSLNPISGIPGKVFRDHREQDIELVCRMLLESKVCK